MKNQALGFSKINTDKTWRSALGWEGGRSAPINATTRQRININQHRHYTDQHWSSSILAGFGFVLGE